MESDESDETEIDEREIDEREIDKKREIDETESRILFELEGISHLINEISPKLTRIAILTKDTGPVAQQQTLLINSLNDWKELFAQHPKVTEKNQD